MKHSLRAQEKSKNFQRMVQSCNTNINIGFKKIYITYKYKIQIAFTYNHTIKDLKYQKINYSSTVLKQYSTTDHDQV